MFVLPTLDSYTLKHKDKEQMHVETLLTKLYLVLNSGALDYVKVFLGGDLILDARRIIIFVISNLSMLKYKMLHNIPIGSRRHSNKIR